MKLNVLKLFLFMTMMCQVAMAQDNVNLKFGKPTKEEMQMTVYEAEPDAEAVVLCRLTDVEYTVQTTSFLVDYREKCRIKVLKPSGARFAKVVVPFQKNMSAYNIGGSKITAMSLPKPGGSSDSYFEGEGVSMTEQIFDASADEMVESIKATAFNQEGGKMAKTSLKKSDIVTTKIDEQNYQVEFTVPNVKEGTVIEYEYNIHSQLFWTLRDWYAQGEIPVVYAKLDMNIPNYLIFNIEDHGIQRLTYTCTMGSLKFKVVSDPLANPMTVNTNHYVYIGRNLKGMPKDNYVWNIQDHCAGITAELKTYRLPGMNQMDYAKTWEQIDEMLLDDDDFGKQTANHSPLRETLETAKVKDIANEQERAAEVCRQVLNHVKWNGKYEIHPENTSETLKKGEGTNADINMLLIQSLCDAGLQAYPVVLRERSKGLLPYNFPSLSKLSTYVVGIKYSNGALAYIDASSKAGHLNALPEVLQVEKARLIAKGKGSTWVNLQKISRAQTATTVVAVLDADGKLTGTQTTLNKTLDTKEEVAFTKQGEVKDGKIYINPFYTAPIEKNPFTAETRIMPVEFPSELSEQMTIDITLPEGYVLESEPWKIVATTPDKGIEGRLVTTTSEKMTRVRYLFNINKVSHSEKNYDTLRGIFDLISKRSAEPLIFKKN